MNNFIYLAIWPFDVIGDAIATFFYYILLWFNAVIYSLISFIYQIFLVLAQGTDIFDDSVIEGLTSRIYVIIGVVILFLVAYSLLKSMVNPDEALKGKKSVATIVKDVIISIVLIAVVPYIFDFAFQFQDSLLRNNTIGKIVAGTTDDGSENAETIANGGYIMASTIWQAFLYPADGYCRTSNEENNGYFDVTHDPCEVLELDDGRTYGDLWEEAEDNTTFFALTSLGKFIVNGQLNYLFIVDAATGIFVLFVLLSYCIDTALRLVKLAVFQLIAPIPIFARILPNEQANKVFGNWIKATISTFVEVFIRIAILYFAVIIITSITRSIDDILFSSFEGSASFMVVGIAKVMIIVGIIMFIKQAPQIIKDITGLDSGKYGKSLIKGIGMMGATFGGGATAAIRRAVTDKKEHPEMGKGQRFGRALSALGGGMRRGIWQGSKVEKLGDISKAAGRTASNTLRHAGQIDAAGGGLKGTLEYYKQKGANKLESIGDFFGGSSSEENRIKQEAIAKYTKLIDSIEDIWKKDAGYIELTKTMQQLKASAHGNVEQYLAYIKQAAKELEAQGYSNTEAKIIAANRVSQDTDLQSRFGITNIEQFDQEMYNINEQQRIMDNLEAQIKVKKAPQINGILQQVYETQRAYSDLTFTENGVTRNIFGQPLSKEDFDRIASTSSLQSGNKDSIKYISELIDISNNSKNINAQLSAEAVGKEARKSRMGEDKKK